MIVNFNIKNKWGITVLYNATTSIKRKFYVYLICCIVSVYCIRLSASENDSLYWAKRMAESVIKHSSHIDVYGNDCLSYVYATAMKGFRELWNATGDSAYFHYLQDGADRSLPFYSTIASSTYHDIDPVNAGNIFLFLYEETGDEKYKSAADSTLKFLKAFPRTADGGFYHKDVPRMQVDDLYMASPFLAEYGKCFNSQVDYAEAVRQCILMEKHTRYMETGLLHHAWYEKEYYGAGPGCTPFFWGRGVGWVAMSLVDVLDYLPEEYTGRDSIILVVQRLAEAISNVQDDSTGLWWQVMDMGGEEGNFLESSGSSMFVYMLAKSIRLGYIDESYMNCTEKGFQGIIKYLIEENADTTINITNVCPGQGPGWSYEVYVRTPTKNDHAVGPFIMAAIEAARLNIDVGQNPNHNIFEKTMSLSVYPNSFSYELTITYNVTEKEHVTLDIYNMTEEKVVSLVNDTKPRGTYSSNYLAAGQDAAIYICRLKTGNKVAVRRVILIK